MDNGTLIIFHKFLFFFFYHLKRSREFWVIVMSFKKHALFNIYSLACTYLNFINLNMSVYICILKKCLLDVFQNLFVISKYLFIYIYIIN